jgi:ArsR family metal-binding transcriptional regulator
MSGEMGLIAKAIPTIAYNAQIPVASFRYKDWRVILNAHEVMVKDIETEADAVEVMEYMKGLTEKAQQKG